MNWTPDERVQNAINERDFWNILRCELQEQIEYANGRLRWWRDEVQRLIEQNSEQFRREVSQ